jgi:hypothetical protein
MFQTLSLSTCSVSIADQAGLAFAQIVRFAFTDTQGTDKLGSHRAIVKWFCCKREIKAAAKNTVRVRQCVSCRRPLMAGGGGSVTVTPLPSTNEARDTYGPAGCLNRFTIP